MAFKLISRHDPVFFEVDATANEAFVYGQCIRMVNGRATAAAAGGVVAGVTIQAKPATAAVEKIKVIWVDPEQNWQADYVGVADPGFIPGLATADIDTGINGGVGANLNAADVVGGPCAILEINAADRKAIVKFKNRQLT